MESITIRFPNGNRAPTIYTSSSTDGTAIVAALGLPPVQGLLMISGGASGMTQAQERQLQELLIESVSRVAAEENLAVIDGGTQAGVMQIIGEGHAAAGSNAPLIGVCPAALVTWPGGPAGEERVPLESHHTHFVLTEGDRWGAETETMFALAAELSLDMPSLAILANGGPVSKTELMYNVRQGREVIVIRDSGRLADAVAAACENSGSADDHLAGIVYQGRITVFDIADDPAHLATMIRRKLFERVLT